MGGWRIVQQLEPVDHRAVRRLLGDTGTHLPDHLAVDLTDPRPGFLAVLGGDSRELTGYAQASSLGDDAWQVVAVPSADAEAMGALLAALRHRRSGRATWWTNDDDGAASAAACGMRAGRGLLQMRVDLPLDDTVVAATRPIVTRPLRASDEQAWLTLNAAAFAHHPEQGGWDLATLRQRQAEPWWDPDGFLIAEEAGATGTRMVGFCWTKIHRDLQPPDGEIYVIGVDPAAHGRGLGRSLTVAGLTWLAARGVSRGMLYVDADNTAAVHLYHRLGFTTVRTEQAYEITWSTDDHR